MMFGHPSQHGHMMAGVAKAAKSPNTPKHLKAHLEARMKKIKGQPITGAATEMKPGIGKQGGGGPAAQSQIMASPAPFQNPKGPLQSVANKKAPMNNGNKGGKKSAFYGGH